MCGPEPCTSPTPCGRCERGAARLAANETATRQRMDQKGVLDKAYGDADRVTRMLRVLPASSD
jgi:hypothetical protein